MLQSPNQSDFVRWSELSWISFISLRWKLNVLQKKKLIWVAKKLNYHTHNKKQNVPLTFVRLYQSSKVCARVWGDLLFSIEFYDAILERTGPLDTFHKYNGAQWCIRTALHKHTHIYLLNMCISYTVKREKWNKKKKKIFHWKGGWAALTKIGILPARENRSSDSLRNWLCAFDAGVVRGGGREGRFRNNVDAIIPAAAECFLRRAKVHT